MSEVPLYVFWLLRGGVGEQGIGGGGGVSAGNKTRCTYGISREVRVCAREGGCRGTSLIRNRIPP